MLKKIQRYINRRRSAKLRTLAVAIWTSLFMASAPSNVSASIGAQEFYSDNHTI